MVVWTATARNSLKQIHDFIALDSPHYAKEVVDNILDLADELNTFPSRGRVVPERNQPSLRELFLYSYRIIYRVDEHDVFILTILHGKRNFPTGI